MSSQENINGTILSQDTSNRKELPFLIIPTLGDGNFGLRSISKALVGHEDQHWEIRQNVLNYVPTVWDNVKETLNNGRVASNAKPFGNVGEYISFMGKDKEYATEFELGMFAQAYGINGELCMLYDEESLTKFRRYGLTIDDFFNVQTFTRYLKEKVDYHTVAKTIKLLFSGNRESGYYELLQERAARNANKNEYENQSLTNVQNYQCMNDRITVKKRNRISDGRNSKDSSRNKNSNERDANNGIKINFRRHEKTVGEGDRSKKAEPTTEKKTIINNEVDEKK